MTSAFVLGDCAASQAHKTVMLHEAIDALNVQAGGYYVDATFGRGGHAGLLLSRLDASAHLHVYDKDMEAITQARAWAAQDSRILVSHDNFSALANLPAGSVAGILMDLGVSSPQLDNAARGFSFRRQGPLDMRMDTSRGQSVAQWLADAPVEVITEVIRDYGEERFAAPIARAIERHRTLHGPLLDTLSLAAVVASAVKTREPGKDPATRTFQALRIFINAELEQLQQALNAALEVLAPDGRLVVISFHSLEDRIVKQFMAAAAKEPFDRRAPFASPCPMPLKLVGRLKPQAAEIASNPRARSAVMRVAQRTSASVKSGSLTGMGLWAG